MSGLLTDGIESIKGIGAARREQLSKLGITTVEELLCYMPRTYRDLTDLRTVEGMEVSRALVWRTYHHNRSQGSIHSPEFLHDSG